ncbi:putative sucrose-phosphate synthase 1 [Wolffia australiana]
MAGNDWINSYLEAILDSEQENIGRNSSLLVWERGGFSPTRYFVEEVISGFDETDLFKTWLKVAATKGTQERSTRLENMCWRIWNLARRKKQIEGEEARRLIKRRIEREKARKDATADMSEEFSEGERPDTVFDSSSQSGTPRICSAEAIESWARLQKDEKLYIVLISLHGLVRGENMELGRDSDTGGQVKYVVELARALGTMPGVYRVDLLTRQVSDSDVDSSYGEPTEMLSGSITENGGESSGAYIVRIPFGPKNKYLAKELLWPYIQEFVDGALTHVFHMSQVLGDQINGGQPVWPVAIHGHYADAGEAAALISSSLNVPMVFTGHSLGRDKLEQLMKQGRQSREEINAKYKIMRRIEAEEVCLDSAEIIITSTRQEIDGQWCLYDGFDVVLERKLRARIRRGVSCYGRFMPRMIIIPPGMEFNHLVDGDADGDGGVEEHPVLPDPPIWAEIMRFLANPRKPMILAIARPDPKKNIVMLVKAFGESRALRELANLTLIMGNRDTIDEMPSTSASMLTAVLKLIDKYDLYGQVAYPKHHRQSDVPEIYRLAAKTKGVVINPAFVEPFGLTLIEAASHGLPMVATKNGGPVDIQKVLDNGLLVDPNEQEEIAGALLKLFADRQLWARCRQNGLNNIHLFSWPQHCMTYLSRLTSCSRRQPKWRRSHGGESESPESPNDSLRDFNDISLNLKLSMDGDSVGAVENENKALNSVCSKMNNHNAEKFGLPRMKNPVFVLAMDCDEDEEFGGLIKKIIGSVRESGFSRSGFIMSTSRTVSVVKGILTSQGMRPVEFDAFVCSSGSDIYYPSEDPDRPFALDEEYHAHIAYRWGGEDLRRTLVRWADSEEQCLTEDEQRSSAYCLAFSVRNPEKVAAAREMRKLLRTQALRCHVLYSHDGSKLQAIPVLASRSQALRYLYVRWGVELAKMVVFVGEGGSTDYQGMIYGSHKTVIMRGVCSGHAMEDAVAFDSPNIVWADAHAIDTALSELKLLPT